MSASTEKKVRTAQREAGTDKKSIAAREEEKKKAVSKRRWTLACIGIVLLIALVLVLNSTFIYTGTTAAVIGGKNYSPAQLNYAYANQYQTFYSNYGSYAAYFGLDTSDGIAGLASQTCSFTEDGGTWKDYFLDAAISSIKQNDALTAYAAENGIELDEDEKAEITDSYASLEETATSYGYKNADALIAANYGRGNNVATATADSMASSLASKAYSQKQEEVEASVTDEEVQEEYPTVAVRHILIKAVADEDGVYTDEAKAEAQAKAEALLAQFNGTATDEQLALIAEMDAELAAQAAEEAAEAEAEAEEAAAEDAEATEDAAAEEVAEDAEATEDAAVEEAAEPEATEEPVAAEEPAEATEETTEETETAEEPAEATEETETAEEPAEDAEEATEEDAAEDAAEPAEEEAAEEEAKPAYGTEEYFAELANTYSEDTGSNTNGGLYNAVMEGQMVTEFNDWCFDESRQSGDTGVVYGESSSYAGYHVIYFVGEGDPADNTTGRSYVVSEKMSAWLEELTADMDVKTTFFYRLVGKMG